MDSISFVSFAEDRIRNNSKLQFILRINLLDQFDFSLRNWSFGSIKFDFPFDFSVQFSVRFFRSIFPFDFLFSLMHLVGL